MTQQAGESRCQAQAASCTLAVAASCTLAVALTGLLIEIGPPLPLRLVAAACSAFLLATVVPNVRKLAVDAGQLSADNCYSDVQRQYAIRRLRGTDTIPYINRSDKAVELCVSLSRTKFCGEIFSSIQNIQCKIDVLESNSLSLMTTFQNEMHGHMQQLLLHSTAASRRRSWRAPAFASFVVGGSVCAASCLVLSCLLVAFRIHKLDSYELFVEDLGWLG